MLIFLHTSQKGSCTKGKCFFQFFFFYLYFSNPSFHRFCFERGHILSATAAGSYGCMESYTPRPVDNLLWPEGSVRLPVPSWKSFHDIWKRSCSNVRIRKHCEDTCPECFVLSNRFRYREAPDRDDDSDGSNSDSSDSEHYPYEDLIEQASNHAEEAQQQRRLAKYRQQQAMDESEEPHENRRFVILFVF